MTVPSLYGVLPRFKIISRTHTLYLPRLKILHMGPLVRSSKFRFKCQSKMLIRKLSYQSWKNLVSIPNTLPFLLLEVTEYVPYHALPCFFGIFISELFKKLRGGARIFEIISIIFEKSKDPPPQNFVKKCLKILEKYNVTPIDFQILSINRNKLTVVFLSTKKRKEK